MNETERKRRTIINFAYYAMMLAIFYLFCRYALWLFLPLIISFIIAVILQRPVNAITRKTPIKKGAASAFCVLFLIIIIGSVIVLIGASVVSYLKDFGAYIAALFENTDKLITDIENWCINFISRFPQGISKILLKSVNSFFNNLNASLAADAEVTAQAAQSVTDAAQNAAGQISQSSGMSFNLSWLTAPLSSVLSTAKQIPTILTSVIITIVASCFLTADYSSVSKFLMNQLSTKRQNDLTRAKHLLKTSFTKMLRAYLIIILITFTEMFIGLSVLKLAGIYESKYIVIIAAVTAIVDIVPVLGTGTVVIPWAVYSLFTDSIPMAIGLIVIYIVISVIRQIIEPKLVAGQLGLPPFVTIIGMYVGLKLFGFIGMLIMPIMIIMLKLLNDEGILHIWKTQKQVDEEQAEKEVPVPAAAETDDSKEENNESKTEK